ncbi:hypothetical protein IGK47_002174 [Enterococcus sp. AZ007]
MITSRIDTIFNTNIEKVWQIVTNAKWRSDLNKIEMIED